jgi:hypothetical protein
MAGLDPAIHRASVRRTHFGDRTIRAPADEGNSVHAELKLCACDSKQRRSSCAQV